MKLSDIKETQPKSKSEKSKGIWDFDLNQEISFNKKFNNNDKISLYRDLSITLTSGADVASAFLNLSNSNKKSSKILYESIYQDLLNGFTLSESFKHTNKFSEFEIVSIEIGENTGLLEEVFSKLGESLERNRELKRQIISVSTYPLFLLLITSGILIFMLYAVVPTFKDLYARFDAELPSLTRAVLSASEVVTIYTIVGGFILTGVIVGYVWIKKNSLFIRKSFSKIIKLIPIIKNLYIESVLAQYFSYFSLMLRSGIPINMALSYLGNLTYLYPLKEETEKMRHDLESGKALSKSMANSKIFSPYIVSLVELGEQSNSLGKIFINLSDQFQKKSEFTLKTFGSLIEPIMIVLIAMVVATILLAMYLPIFKLSSGI